MTCDDGGTAFSMTAHVCRYCAGRVVRAGDQFRCAGCEVVTMNSPEGICGCGLLGTFRIASGGFRCAKNTAKSAANPSAYVIELYGQPIKAAA